LFAAAAALILFAATQAIFVLFAQDVLGLGSFGYGVLLTVSFRQAVVPEDIFGRVNSVYRFLGWGGLSVGALLGGFLARSFGLTARFWFAADTLVIMFLLTLPLVNNRTVAEARTGQPSA
jgi:hypothetical protein